MKTEHFNALMSKMDRTLSAMHLVIWRRAMMKRVSMVMVAILVLLYGVQWVEESTGPTAVLVALRGLAQVLSGGCVFFIGWLAFVRTLPKWAKVPPDKKAKSATS